MSDELTALIASHDGPYDDRAFHRAVYDHIRHLPLPATACPPLPVLVYAVRNILEPTFVLEQIPDLLRLLVHLEILRNNAVRALQAVLQESKSDPKLRLLEKDVREPRLQAARTIYRKIIHGCCLLHIHHLWRTYDPTTDAPITTHFFRYYPAFAAGAAPADCQRALKEQAIHHDLSEDELDANREEGEAAAGFLVDAAQYTEDPEAYCLAHGFENDESFDDVFAMPDVDGIVGAIMRFVKEVKSVLETLDKHLV